MHDRDFIDDAEYWSNKITESYEQLKPTFSYDQPLKTTYTYEEAFLLRLEIMQLGSYSRLLKYRVEQERAEINKPYWKKLFRK